MRGGGLWGRGGGRLGHGGARKAGSAGLEPGGERGTRGLPLHAGPWQARAVSTSCWPIAWRAPAPSTAVIRRGAFGSPAPGRGVEHEPCCPVRFADAADRPGHSGGLGCVARLLAALVDVAAVRLDEFLEFRIDELEAVFGGRGRWRWAPKRRPSAAAISFSVSVPWATAVVGVAPRGGAAPRRRLALRVFLPGRGALPPSAHLSGSPSQRNGHRPQAPCHAARTRAEVPGGKKRSAAMLSPSAPGPPTTLPPGGGSARSASGGPRTSPRPPTAGTPRPGSASATPAPSSSTALRA